MARTEGKHDFMQMAA